MLPRGRDGLLLPGAWSATDRPIPVCDDNGRAGDRDVALLCPAALVELASFLRHRPESAPDGCNT